MDEGRREITSRLAAVALALAAGLSGCERAVETPPATRRELADWAALAEPAATRSAPEVDSSAAKIVLPAGSSLSWAMQLPGDTALAWDAAGVPKRAELLLAVQAGEGGEVETLTAIREGKGRQQLGAGSAGSPRLIGFSLRNPGAGTVTISGVRLESPSFPLRAASLANEGSPSGVPGATGAERPNLVIYLIDTLRADHLGCYGYPKPTTPRIDEFAREGVLFEEARAQSSWTKPAVATILTGVYPVTHRAELRALGLAPGVRTLADRLRVAGYETVMFTTNPTVTGKFGFDRGFESFNYVHELKGRRRRSVDSAAIHAEVMRWLERRDRARDARPFFLVVHTLDPHDPYRPSEPFRSRFAPGVDVESACCFRGERLEKLTPEQAERRARDSRALYDGEIAKNDASFGLLLDELRRRRLLDRSALLFTSDHGEEFHEHGGWRHAESLFEEVLRVPLVLRLPGGAFAGRRITDPADEIDIAPTLLELAGLPRAEELPGGSWLAALAGGEPPPRESLAWLRHPSFNIAAIRDGAWKWIRHDGAARNAVDVPGESLFDLESDRAERRNLAPGEPLRRRWLAGRSRAATTRFGRAGASDEVEIDEELDKELRALGYL